MRQTPHHPPHVVASSEAATTSSHAKDPDSDPEHVAARVIEMLPRLHVLVIGPGLGRDPLMQATVARVIRAARASSVPLVLDADALLVVQKDPGLVRGYAGAVLTPNVVEFGRLCEAIGVEAREEVAGETARVEALARALGGVTVVEKGRRDRISNGDTTLVVDLPGGRKRSGGQGDTLTGAVATFLAWRKAYMDGLWDVGGKPLGEHESLSLAVFGGSAITRVSEKTISYMSTDPQTCHLETLISRSLRYID